jgi:hypothetical protein
MPAEELAAVYAMSPVANETFTGMVNRPDSVMHSQSGWDPYEVWRTRLKRPAVATQEREPLLPCEASAAAPVAAPDP